MCPALSLIESRPTSDVNDLAYAQKRINFNFLIGGAYAKLSSGHAANLEAEVFRDATSTS